MLPTNVEFPADGSLETSRYREDDEIVILFRVAYIRRVRTFFFSV